MQGLSHHADCLPSYFLQSELHDLLGNITTCMLSYHAVMRHLTVPSCDSPTSCVQRFQYPSAPNSSPLRFCHRVPSPSIPDPSLSIWLFTVGAVIVASVASDCREGGLEAVVSSRTDCNGGSVEERAWRRSWASCKECNKRSL